MLYIKSVDPCEKKTTNVLKEKNDMVENLKCCGNCGNSASCGNQKKLCSSWIYDGKTKEERKR